MAVVTRYVNTASSAGGDGTTNATSGANRAYASLNEWEADEQTDLVTAADNHIVFCEGSSADTAAVVVLGWTTGAANDIVIKTTQANRHSGKWDTGKYRIIAAGYFAVLRIQEEYVSVIGLQFDNSHDTTGGANANGIWINNLTGSYDILITHCVVRKTTAVGPSIGINSESNTSSSTITLINNIVYDFNDGIKHDGSDNDTVNIYNNHSIGNANTGILYIMIGSSDTLNLRNNVCFNNTDDYNSVGFTAATESITHNAYSQGADPGSSGVDISADAGTDLFEAYASDDFHLRAGSSLLGVGVDLSGTFTDDIDGETRVTPWDIGADALIAVGGANAPTGNIYGPLSGPFAGVV